MHNLFCAILVLRIVQSCAFKSPPASLQKCCAVDEQFKRNDKNDLECDQRPIWPNKPLNDADIHEPASEWQWFVNELLQTPENKTISFKTKPNCSSSSMDILYNGHNRHEFNLVVRDNEAFLESLKNDSLSDLSIVFPSRSYCVDVAPGGLLVALLCPCATVQCVRKCCATTQVFNASDSACMDSQVERDVFPEGDATFGRIEYYLLTSTRLDCSKRNFYQMTYNDTSGPSFFLLKNGSLQMQNSFDNLIDWNNNSYYRAFGLHWKLARRSGDEHSSIENTVDPAGWIFQPEDYCWDFADDTRDTREVIQVCYTGEVIVDPYRLFGVLFMTVAFALLIGTVLVLILAHACYCRRAYRTYV